MKPKDRKALQALQVFLDDRDVYDIDVEPQARGVTITARRNGGKSPYEAWGLDISDAVNNMVRCVTR